MSEQWDKSASFDGFAESLERIQGPVRTGFGPYGLPLPFTITAWISPLLFRDQFPSQLSVIAGRAGKGIVVGVNTIVRAGYPSLILSRFGGVTYVQCGMQYSSLGAGVWAVHRRAYPFVDTTLWDFYAGTFTPGDGGTRLWAGDFDTAVSAQTPAFRFAESGTPGEGTPKTVIEEDLVVNGTEEWMGDWTIGGPQHPGSRFAWSGIPFRGRIAHVTHWADVLTIDQLEELRTAPPANRPSLVGYPELLGDWWLDEPKGSSYILDHSGNERHLRSFPPRVVRRSGRTVWV